jgi:arginine/ornithine permease
MAHFCSGGQIEDLKFKVPLYPVLPLIALVLNTIVLGSMAFDAEQRMALYVGIPLALLFYAYYHARVKKKVDLSISRQEVQLKDDKKVIL